VARFLIDECVPKSISDFLKKTPHDVSLVKDVLLEGTPDQVVAKIAEEQQAIIVTWNVKDFKRETKRFKFGMLSFRCPEPTGLALLEQDFELIHFELGRAEKDGRRFWCEIQKAGIKIHHPAGE